MVHDEHDEGPPIGEAALVSLAPELVRALVAEAAGEAQRADYPRMLDRVGARLAALLETDEVVSPAVRAALAAEVQPADYDGLDAVVMARVEMAANKSPGLPAVVLSALRSSAPELPRELVTPVLAQLDTLALDEPLPAVVVSALASSVPTLPRELMEPVLAQLEALSLEESLPAEVVSALASSVPAPPRDLVEPVLANIHALSLDEPLPAGVVRALADEASPGAAPSLTQAIMAKIERTIEDELATEPAALAAIHAELLRESERMHTERVVSEVRAEVQTIGPRLERDMPRAVEQRIAPPAPVVASPARETAARDSGRPRPARGYAPTGARKTSTWLGGRMRAALGAVAAVAATLAAVYLRPPAVDPLPGPPELAPLHALGPRGEVHVDEVDYDGTVTVMESDGVAVIWLADS